MAGGYGTRMNTTIPKVLCKFKSVPFIVRIVKEALRITDKIIVVTGNYNNQIKRTVYQYITPQNEIFVPQINPMGTGDAVKRALNYYNTKECKEKWQLSNTDNPSCIILNGDMPAITHKILTKIVTNHLQNGVVSAILPNPRGYGRIVEKEDGSLERIVEQKDCTQEENKITKVNMGIYVFDINLLIKHIYNITSNNIQHEYYITDMIKILSSNGIKLHNMTLLDPDYKYVLGVNTLDELNQLEEAIDN